MIAHVANRAVHLEPLEGLCGLCRIKPFPGQLWCEHDLAPVVNVHHPTGAVRSDDHESVVLTWTFVVGKLPNGCA